MDSQIMLQEERRDALVSVQVHQINCVLKLGQQASVQSEECPRRTATDGKVQI
jgi:hypothetical protein